MNTHELIDMLASNAPAVDRRIVARRFTFAIAAGLLLGVLALLMFLGIRPDLAEVAVTPLFWLKLAFPASLLAGSLWITTRLARPGMAVGASWAAIATPLTAIWLAALGLLISVPSGSRQLLVFGETWRVCPVNIALLSIPTFFCVFWAIRGLAPTRPRLAGAAGGLLASSTATLVYSLHCPEMSVAFWAVWYVLGMAVPALIGALLGPRLLRW
ncbi:DUF1109 domain-containing protein [Stutzerimonas chloritidismutans]|uniref:DUF1109 domain-containing protein n=1 Tax=Stutzerimonas chloritidismutans TaxID=203192 RepID=UPI003F18E5BD